MSASISPEPASEQNNEYHVNLNETSATGLTTNTGKEAMPPQVPPDGDQSKHEANTANKSAAEVLNDAERQPPNTAAPSAVVAEETMPPPPKYEADSGKIVYPAEVDNCLAIDRQKVKTVLCINFMHGRRCRFGSHCAFAHGEAELRAPPEEMLKKKASKEEEKQAKLESLRRQLEEEAARIAAEGLPPPPEYREPARRGRGQRGRGGGRARGSRGGGGASRGGGRGRGRRDYVPPPRYNDQRHPRVHDGSQVLGEIKPNVGEERPPSYRPPSSAQGGDGHVRAEREVSPPSQDDPPAYSGR